MALSRDEWLSGMIGKPVLKLSLVNDAGDGAGVDAALGAPSPEPRLVFAKVPAGRIDQARWLEDRGFRLVSTDVNLALDPVKAPRPSPLPSGLVIRAAEPGDIAGVAETAGRAFSASRFHRDPAVDPAVADRIKAAWAGNFFSGARGDAMLVALSGGRVVGFNQLVRKAPEVALIDLIAVHPDQRGRGLGRALIAWIPLVLPGIRRVLVTTQLDNTASLGMYQDAGFRVLDAAYVFHRHDQPEGQTCA